MATENLHKIHASRATPASARAFIALIQPDLLAPREYDESGPSER